MSFLNKFKAEKKNPINDMPKLPEMEAKVRQCYFDEFLHLYMRIVKCTPETGKKSKERILQMLGECPDFLHCVDEDGYDIVYRVEKLGSFNAFFDILNESEARGNVGASELCIKKFAEKQPSCFSVLEAENGDHVDTMNAIIKKYGLDPVNAHGQKWSKLYKEARKRIDVKLKEQERRFNNGLEDLLESVKNVNR